MLRAAAMRRLLAMSCLSGSWNGCRSGATMASLRTSTTAQLQQTLSAPVTREGVGLHTGERATVRLLPAGAGEGRYFVKLHKEQRTILPALVENVTDTRLSTCLGRHNSAVRTVEHLMSALEGLGVDNCRIEIQGGDEVPLLDGSARDWVEAIEESGHAIATDPTGAQAARNAFVVDAPISVTHGDSFVAAFPSPVTRLTYGIDFPQVAAIGSRWFSWTPIGACSYKTEVAPARTFGIAEQIEELRAAGLIKGGSLENALVCSVDKGWLNPPLRFNDEPCRHKLLDLVGDLALSASPGHAGLPVAHVIAFKASHALHVKFAAALLRHRMQCVEAQV